MADETVWRVIFSDEEGGGGATAAGGGPQSQQSANEAGYFEAAFSFVKQILPFAGALGIVIQSIRRSKVFSTFMDAFLTTLSAMVDLLLIPLIPILMPALQLLISALPFIQKISESVAGFLGGLKNIPDAISKLFPKAGEIIANIGTALSKAFDNPIFQNIGSKLGELFGKLGTIFGTGAKDIWSIVTDDSKDFWTKVGDIAAVVFKTIGQAGSAVWETVKRIWNEDILPALKQQFPGLFDAISKAKGAFDKVVSIIDTINNVVNTTVTIFNDLVYAGRILWRVFSDLFNPIQAFKDIISAVTNPGKLIGSIIHPGRAIGDDFIQNEGYYYLHQGETVMNAARTRDLGKRGGPPVTVVNNITVSGPSGAAAGYQIASTLAPQIKQISVQGWR